MEGLGGLVECNALALDRSKASGLGIKEKEGFGSRVSKKSLKERLCACRGR